MAVAASVSTLQGVAEQRGIPATAFVEDVEAYLHHARLDVNSALALLQERYHYGLDTAVLQFAKALLADFELSEGIYTHAKIEDADLVCLLLGANVMLEYAIGQCLLKKNLENAKGSLEVLVADLQFLRDQQPSLMLQLLGYSTGMYTNGEANRL